MEGFAHNHPILTALLRVVLWVIPVLLFVVPVIWYERRLLGWIQDRVGPNRVGPFGLLQPIADGAKLFFKEEIIPNGVDRFLYVLAPGLSLFPAFAMGAVVPFGPDLGVYAFLTPIADPNIGILYVLGMSSLGVYGLVLAGYSGNNKYSLMGGLRASAQLISYELAMGMALAGIVMVTGSLKITDMVKAQQTPLWGFQGSWLENWNAFTPFGFVAMIVFLICMIAETNRAPFDLPEAENELIAGYHTEYSSMKFAAFYMGEYAAMIVFGTILVSVFLGGYNMLPVNWTALAASAPGLAGFCHAMQWLSVNFAPVWLIGKVFAVITGYIWIRATLPRLRYDQLMTLGWKILLPAATANLVVIAAWLVMTDLYGTVAGWGVAVGSLVVGIVVYANIVAFGKGKGGVHMEERSIRLVEAAPPAKRSIELVDPSAGASGAGVG